MTHIFISYSRNDKPIVDKLYLELKEAGLDPWMDEPPHPYGIFGIQPGENWEKVIRTKLQTAKLILVFFSNNSVVKSGYIQKEYRLALKTLTEKPPETIFLIPILIDKCEVPYIEVDTVRYDQLHWFKYYERTSQDLIRVIIRALEISNGKLDESERTISTNQLEIARKNQRQLEQKLKINEQLLDDIMKEYSELLAVNAVREREEEKRNRPNRHYKST